MKRTGKNEERFDRSETNVVDRVRVMLREVGPAGRKPIARSSTFLTRPRLYRHDYCSAIKDQCLWVSRKFWSQCTCSRRTEARHFFPFP